MSYFLNAARPRHVHVFLTENDHVILEGKAYIPYRQNLGYLLVRSDKPDCQRFVSDAGLHLMLENATARIQSNAVAC
ncbi:hypothetical protein HJB88_12155 [Rhizobium sp. NZLR5]|uniref:hypothetical protein n=1 Tax=Rhizobium sp. NZLR5 TaxID=2731103 RepID=UPI001C82C4EC|nr:hypothetical protein [Rhizobium sp. NZLR5]MBX5183389.1 hypothetical protein [Rhizobium sp. NZLR5]